MNRQFVLGTVLAVTLAAAGSMSAVNPQQGKTRQTTKRNDVCWPGEQEFPNPNTGKRRPSHLPPELESARVQRSVVLLKLCVSETGRVARVLVLESSGNAAVDKYYSTELSKWVFTPAEKEKRKVRSVVPVAVNLYIK